MNKGFRQSQIRELIRSRVIRTQEELAAALEARGVQSSQVTLSRDIRELGIVKTPEGYRERGPLEASARSERDTLKALGEFLRDARAAQNLVVLKTDPGNASPLARALDRAPWAEVVGTLAGDDTVLVVTPDAASAEALRSKLGQVLGKGS